MNKWLIINIVCLCVGRLFGQSSSSDLIWDQGKYLNADSSAYSGIIRDSYPDGQLQFVVTIKNGLADGVAKTFYPSGQSHWVIGYQAGIPSGGFSEQFANGDMKFLCQIMEPKVGGGNQIEKIRYAYYTDSIYVNKTKVFGTIHFITAQGLTAYSNAMVPPHLIAGYQISDHSKKETGLFIKDSREIIAPDKISREKLRFK